MTETIHITRKKLWAGTALQALAFAGFGIASLAAVPAHAQSTTSADEQEEAAQEIVVTGSLIRRDEFTTIEPLTVITNNEITQAGFNSAAETLQSTSVTQGASQINNYYGGYVTDGGPGANTLGLRGLGPSRTLVLLNGHRIAPAGSRGSVGSADLNVLPTALIQRIEILKAGASSIYGSDAIAGVVNIITDDQFNGLTIQAQTNVPEVGAGASQRLSASFGYQGDRLSIIGSVEYYNRSRLSRNDVDFTSCPIGGSLSGEGTAMGSGDYIDPTTGRPACFTLDNGGVTINTLGVPTRAGVDRLTGLTGNYNRFVPSASNVAGATPGYLGVNTYTRDTYDPEQEEEDLVSPAEIYTGFLSATYDLQALGDAQVYVELLGNQRHSSQLLYRQLTLDYAQGSPLVEAQFRNGIFLAPNSISNGNYVAARAFIGFGNTEQRQEVSFARLAGGLRGKFFFDDWRYDLYLSKSFSDSNYYSESFLTDRIARSLDVVSDGNGGFVCATTSDPNCVAAPLLNAATIGGDLPQNYVDYILQNVRGTTKYREFVGSFNINGPIFALPGGDAQLALGFEYRDASIDDQPPADSVNGNLYGLTSAAPTVGSDAVREVYGELYLPLLANVPGAYALSLDGSLRFTDYDSYGSDWTYKVSGEWQPIRGIGFRASYGTSYRAPALFEQFLGGTSGFQSSSADPCDDYANSSNPIIQANCAAIGLPANFQQFSSVTVITNGGADAGLEAETSKNFSAGVVLQPPLPSGFGSLSFAADYFRIEVNNGVSRAGYSFILNSCYGDPSFDPNSGYCRLVERDANNYLTVYDSYVNLATDIRRGIEFNLRYANQVGPGQLVLDANVVHYYEQSGKVFDSDPLEDQNGIITVPDWVGSFNASYEVGRVTLHYGIDWVTGDHDATYTYFATDYDNGGVVDEAYKQYLKDNYYFEVDDYFLHNVSVQVRLEDFTITMGVRNLFNTAPPEISAGGFSMVGNAPLYSGYDYTGRTFFLNTTVGF